MQCCCKLATNDFVGRVRIAKFSMLFLIRYDLALLDVVETKESKVACPG